MAKNFHSRSNSLPSKSHPMMENVENILWRLKSSESTCASQCANLASLRDLHEGINNLIQMPSVQEVLSQEQGQNWINELLEGSLRLVDLCGFSRDVIYSMKESVQELESSMRRNRGEKVTADEIDAYVASRKKTIKNINTCMKNLKSFDKKSTSLQHNVVSTMLKETQALDFSVLKSVLMLLTGEKERSKSSNWSIFSKFSTQYSQESDYSEEYLCSLDIHKSRKSMDSVRILKQLKSSGMMIQEIEEELEALFKCLVKTRVSLLNILSH